MHNRAEQAAPIRAGNADHIGTTASNEIIGHDEDLSRH
jgi:hypothetical protein